MNRYSRLTSNAGFTLIELMVVIVIMGIMASFILINMEGVEQRKAMQAREVLLMDLQKINQEANDQARILALQQQAATDVAPFQYQFIEYQPETKNPASTAVISPEQKWQSYLAIPSRRLPEQISFTIQSLENNYQDSNSQDLMGVNTPQLIWLGNGEAKPARIQFYFAQKPLGNEIEIDHLGKVNEI